MNEQNPATRDDARETADLPEDAAGTPSTPPTSSDAAPGPDAGSSAPPADPVTAQPGASGSAADAAPGASAPAQPGVTGPVQAPGSGPAQPGALAPAQPGVSGPAQTTASTASVGAPVSAEPSAAPASVEPSAEAPVSAGAPAPAAGAPAPDATAAALGALGWVDTDAAAAPRPAPAFVVSGATGRSADLLAGRRRRRILRPATAVPTILLILLIGAYTAATLLWPLTAVQPTVRSVAVQPLPAPAAQPAWPQQGEAAIALEGIPGELSSSASAPESIASITKVVTALVVLDRLPLAPGEQGPSYAFTQADSADYWQYRARGESSLDVPVDGSLTELQMLQGMLIASANNYAQRLASDLFPSNADFVAAANTYLTERGITGITIVNPTGIEAGNTATPAALIALAEKALANPVIAEIVRTPELTLPGAGTFKNGNPLLADPGVVGVKTGTLDAWNLLSAKDFTVGTVTVRAYAAVLGQPGPDTRNQVTRDLFARIGDELQLRPSVTSGTVVGHVETLWGQESDVVTVSDASVVLWNSAVAETSARFDLGQSREAGDIVGALTVNGPLDTDTVDARLTSTIEPPDPWWRLTHPLDLFGLNG